MKKEKKNSQQEKKTESDESLWNCIDHKSTRVQEYIQGLPELEQGKMDVDTWLARKAEVDRKIKSTKHMESNQALETIGYEYGKIPKLLRE